MRLSVNPDIAISPVSLPRSPLPAGAIALSGVAKHYRLYRSNWHRLSDILLGRRTHSDHIALTELDLLIEPGEMVALVGANGAGKSTLLRMIAGTQRPTSGTVEVGGTVAALLELGSGFNSEWTGRANVEFQLRLQGVAGARLSARMAAVQEFADVGEYFDQPLRTCSTGMMMRIAFAAAALAESDIFIVDEALAVGDAAFVQKCFARIAEMKAKGRTIVLVTHRLELVAQLCTRGIVIHQGRVAFSGDPQDAVSRYIDLQFSGSNGNTGPMEEAGQRMGSGGAVLSPTAVDGRTATVISCRSGGTVSFALTARFVEAEPHPAFGLTIKTVEGVVLFATNTVLLGVTVPPAEAGEMRSVVFELTLSLPPGTVFADVAVGRYHLTGGVRMLDARMSALRLDIHGPLVAFGLIDLGARAYVSDQPLTTNDQLPPTGISVRSDQG